MEIAYSTQLTVVVDIIRYLLGQGLAFHGHDESSQSVHRVHVSDTCSQSLKNAIDEFFAKNWLSLSRLRGQGYDGASNMRACLDPSFASFDLEQIFHMAELYSDDFTRENLMELRLQLRSYIHYVRRESDFSNLSDIEGLANKMVEFKADTAFYLIYRLIVLALVLPVTTATVERSFSAMKIIKIDLRLSNKTSVLVVEET
ncbi:uncharacterized protein LOC127259848 [Andrographis paniculata]|uniref:uncharacterized protein LOC127259848 n=1 Tax=Andrographis paniculata TaxID=175694 RepID=UPI0021E99BA5|nr:uncharacterized protein LOC127259848 [Andrographis paniculata]